MLEFRAWEDTSAEVDSATALEIYKMREEWRTEIAESSNNFEAVIQSQPPPTMDSEYIPPSFGPQQTVALVTRENIEHVILIIAEHFRFLNRTPKSCGAIFWRIIQHYDLNFMLKSYCCDFYEPRIAFDYQLDDLVFQAGKEAMPYFIAATFSSARRIGKLLECKNAQLICTLLIGAVEVFDLVADIEPDLVDILTHKAHAAAYIQKTAATQNIASVIAKYCAVLKKCDHSPFHFDAVKATHAPGNLTNDKELQVLRSLIHPRIDELVALAASKLPDMIAKDPFVQLSADC